MNLSQILPSDIDACWSEETLRRWHDAFHTEADELASELHARVVAEDLPAHWVRPARKRLEAYHCAMRRIERRAVALGYELIISRDGRERREIRKLKARVRELEAQLAALGERRAA